MGITLTDVLLFGKAQSDDVDSAAFVIMRRNILRWGAIGGYVSIVVHGVAPLVLPDAIANSLSYVKAFGGTEQRNLPDGYIQRQFIYMMDGSYLLTDIVPTYDGHIEMDFQTTSLTSGLSAYFLGGRTQTYGGLFLVKSLSNTFVVDAFGTTEDDRYTSSVSATSNTRYKFIYDNQVATLTSGGATLFTNTMTGTTANGASLVINGLNNNGTTTGSQAGIYLYSFKAWNAQGELVADYVPAVQKGTVPVVGFYDTVSGTFKTATAGTFAAGGEAVPTPDTPMDIVSNNGVLKVKDSELPVGYRRVLGYACDDDVLWQITDFHLRGSDTVRMSFSVKAGCNVFGCYQGASANDNYDLFVSNSSNAKYLRYGGEAYPSYWSSSNWGRRFDVVFTPNGTDGMPQDSTWTPLTFESENDLLIAATTLAGSSAKLKGNLYGNFIVDGRLKLIPCERVSDGVLGYYDTYSNTFFEPTGTPTSLGYDTSYMTKVYADGTVETINVHGKNLFDVSNNPVEQGNIASTSGRDVASATRCRTDGYISVKPNTTYTLTASIDGYAGNTSGGVFVYQYNEDASTWVGSSWRRPTGYTFTTNSTTVKIRILFGISSSATIVPSDVSKIQLEEGSTATDYEPYYNGGTATAEMLLRLDGAVDEQEILSGSITRKIGYRVFDGSESFGVSNAYGRALYINGASSAWGASKSKDVLCQYFLGTSSPSSNMPEFTCFFNSTGHFYFRTSEAAVDFKAWLASLYAAGTPLVVFFVRATPTTESVAGQPLQVQAGDNYLEITQASLTELELEAQYNAAVSLTIQEVQDANLDNNVTVTIQ